MTTMSTCVQARVASTMVLPFDYNEMLRMKHFEPNRHTLSESIHNSPFDTLSCIGLAAYEARHNDVP